VFASFALSFGSVSCVQLPVVPEDEVVVVPDDDVVVPDVPDDDVVFPEAPLLEEADVEDDADAPDEDPKTSWVTDPEQAAVSSTTLTPESISRYENREKNRAGETVIAPSILA